MSDGTLKATEAGEVSAFYCILKGDLVSLSDCIEELHCMLFISVALLQKLLHYLCSVVSHKHLQCQVTGYLTLAVPHVETELGRTVVRVPLVTVKKVVR